MKEANRSTIKDKLLVGYRGWFTCPKDEKPIETNHNGWLHWFNDNGFAEGGLRPNVDTWPDTSGYDPSELCQAPGLKTARGDQCKVFSSRNEKTVERHFKWMADYGVDGAFLQRSIKERTDGIRRIREEVGRNVQKAAENTGRVFAIMYDVSGVNFEDIEELELDHYMFKSPRYLQEKGKPVVALSGFRFGVSDHTPEFIHSITSRIRETYPGGVYLMGAVPAKWRSPTGNSNLDEQFARACLNCFNAISPYTVRAYGSLKQADEFAEGSIAEDMKAVKSHNENKSWRDAKLEYIPVVFPGWSGHNSSDGRSQFDLDRDPRYSGKFLWRQIFNARKRGARTIYAATWDGYDDGTALMPIVTCDEQLPSPVVVTRQEELSLPVIITYPNQMMVDVTVVPSHNQGLRIIVDEDRDKPPLPGRILISNMSIPIGERGYHINTVLVTHKDQLPQSIADLYGEELPFIVAQEGQLLPTAFHSYTSNGLFVKYVKQDRLPLPVHSRYKFITHDPRGSKSLPSDWYMRICGIAAKSLHSGRMLPEDFPREELEGYWNPQSSSSASRILCFFWLVFRKLYFQLYDL